MIFPDLKYKSKNNVLPRNMGRIYFTCHPQDFEDTFERICADLFAACECVVLYKEDMRSDAADKDLRLINLCVIPVTYRLLTEPNRAMDKDFAFAVKEHIPVIPIMMEDGLDEIYSREDKFGSLQYLNPIRRDPTEISYEDKLKKALESVFTGNSLREEIRKAFNARIFLSYRKKDRAYANDLMRRIHQLHHCQYVGIWYDEMLISGRSFDVSIQNELIESDLVALLVTPNLLEEPDGKPNYVMDVEYKAARNAGKDILPLEAVYTDKVQLREKFPGIPECIDIYDRDRFAAGMLTVLNKLSGKYKESAEKQEYLIGLAYLEGVGVEKDMERGVSMITASAEKKYPEAMKKLQTMYQYGLGVPRDYQKVLEWSDKLADYCQENYGFYDTKTIACVSNLAVAYDNLGKHAEALALFKEVYRRALKSLGENHPETILSLSFLGQECLKMRMYKDALSFLKVARDCMIGSEYFGKTSRDTLQTMGALASAYSEMEQPEEALKLNNDIYINQILFFGKDDPDTLSTLNNLANTYISLKQYDHALETTRTLYETLRRLKGEADPFVLDFLGNISAIYGMLGDRKNALFYGEMALELLRSRLGNEHPVTRSHQKILAQLYIQFKEYDKALALQKELYETECRIEGKNAMETLITMLDIAVTYSLLGDDTEAARLRENVYERWLAAHREDASDSLYELESLMSTYKAINDRVKMAELARRIYYLRKKTHGEGYIQTLEALNLAIESYNLSAYHSRAMELVKDFYQGKEEIPEESFMQYVWLSTNAAITFFFMGMKEDALRMCFWVAGLPMKLPNDMVEHIAWIFEECGYVEKSRQMLARLGE